jgi:hypothetical protein
MIQTGAQDNPPGQILDPNGIPLVDITDRSSRMARNAAILYPNPPPRSGVDQPHYRGMLRLLHDGGMFWVSAWFRTVNGKTVLELRLTPKDGGVS